MFSYLKVFQAMTPEPTSISLHKGSCARQRYKKTSCQHCLDVCPTGALALVGGVITWQAENCTLCLLCTSACSLGALASNNLSYVGILKKLQEVQAPVLACHGQRDSRGHARVPCLGALANEELLLSFALLLGKSFILNMTHCRDCNNQAIIPYLEKAVANVTPKLPAGVQVRLAFASEDLHFRERQCNRRELLTLFRSGAKEQGPQVTDQLQFSPRPKDYVSKRLPFSRSLLLQSYHLSPRQDEISAPSWPQAVFSAACTSCQSCVAICPTGALAEVEGEGEPRFNGQHCVACGLCTEFCRPQALQISAHRYVSGD